MPIELLPGQTIIVDPNTGAQYIQTFISAPETLNFHEKSNRWVSFYDFFPDCMHKVGTEFVSFHYAHAFIHNRDESFYNSFPFLYPSGTVLTARYPSTITTVSNISPSENKIYQSLSEESNEIWEVEALETEDGQTVSIPELNFTRGSNFSFEPGHGTKEKVHYTNIPMDENSPGGIINGSRIRSNSVIAKFKNFTNSFVKLFAVNFNVTKSFRND
jgi:hypothetical protein